MKKRFFASCCFMFSLNACVATQPQDISYPIDFNIEFQETFLLGDNILPLNEENYGTKYVPIINVFDTYEQTDNYIKDSSLSGVDSYINKLLSYENHFYEDNSLITVIYGQESKYYFDSLNICLILSSLSKDVSKKLSVILSAYDNDNNQDDYIFIALYSVKKIDFKDCTTFTVLLSKRL